MTNGGRMDGYAGRSVFMALRAAGLERVETDCHGAVAIGGSLRARFRRDSIGHVRAISPRGAFSESDFDRMLAMFDDPTFAYIDSTWIATWGQRPIEGGAR